VSAEGGKPVSYVHVKSERSSDVEITDRYGRIFLTVPIGQKDTFVFTQQGYKSRELQFTCERFNKSETALVLKRK
jgi:hypothetical protein